MIGNYLMKLAQAINNFKSRFVWCKNEKEVFFMPEIKLTDIPNFIKKPLFLDGLYSA